jgi:putative DNA primase/helicase
VKSNLAPDNGGVAYSLGQVQIADGIEATHTVWAGAIECAARGILNDVEHNENGEGSERLDAEQFLRDLLAGGPLPARQIKANADGAGYAWATVRRAQKSLGIQASKVGMKEGWTWRL